MTTTDSNPQLQALDDSVVVGSDGEIGSVGQVYTDNATGQPSWVTVKTGWFGTKESFVPLASATVDAGVITVPFDKDTIKGAPSNDAGEPLSETDEQQLYTYYGLTPAAGEYDESAARTATTGTAAVGGEAGIPAQATDSAEYLTRSEEQLHVGTEKVQTGRARLRKFVVTEQQSVTVPVTREEVRVVREPVAPGESFEANIGDAQTDVVLTEERVVVSKETVPVERVRLETETVTDQQNVTESVRKEQVEFDGPESVETDARTDR